MTADFVRRIRAAGHTIVAVIDEHNRADWLEALGGFDGLVIEPVSQNEGVIKSSGALLCQALGNLCNHQVEKLLAAADAGDRMDFTTHFSGIVNQSVKSDIGNNARREKLARFFAVHFQPDVQIRGWMQEYEEILRANAEVIAERSELGDQIVRVAPGNRLIDMTVLMGDLYRMGYKIVISEGMMYDKSINGKRLMVSFGTEAKNLDLLKAVEAAGIKAGGFANKVNLDPADEATALEAVRNLLN
jgi:hypothetical protein